jgi:hypothetical protein
MDKVERLARARYLVSMMGRESAAVVGVGAVGSALGRGTIRAGPLPADPGPTKRPEEVLSERLRDTRRGRDRGHISGLSNKSLRP